MLSTERVLAWTAEHRSWAEGIVTAVEPTWVGVPPSEMLAVLVTLRGLGVEHVVESGRHDGTSTEILARAGFALDSVELHPRRRDSGLEYPGLTLHEGDGRVLAPGLVHPGSGVLVDGPKKAAAVYLGRRCLRAGARVAFLHDFHRGQPARRLLPDAWFTDEPAWVEPHAALDREYWRAASASEGAWSRGPHSRPGRSYGPTMAILA